MVPRLAVSRFTVLWLAFGISHRRSKQPNMVTCPVRVEGTLSRKSTNPCFRCIQGIALALTPLVRACLQFVYYEPHVHSVDNLCMHCSWENASKALDAVAVHGRVAAAGVGRATSRLLPTLNPNIDPEPTQLLYIDLSPGPMYSTSE